MGIVLLCLLGAIMLALSLGLTIGIVLTEPRSEWGVLPLTLSPAGFGLAAFGAAYDQWRRRRDYRG